MSKIYVASSWRNYLQPEIVEALRAVGHEVYDFRKPKDEVAGFDWREIDPKWHCWDRHQYIDGLRHPIAEAGFRSDFEAMEWADTFVLVLPCGRSAHLEFGWACGRGKRTAILLDDGEPELMAKLADHLCPSVIELIQTLARAEAIREKADGQFAGLFAAARDAVLRLDGVA